MKLKKHTLIIGGILLLVFIFLFFLSSLVNNYINKNGQELTGRRIELGKLNFNYLKVAVLAQNLVVYEENQRDTFAGFKELYINFDPWKLVRNEYSFSSITLDSLYAYIVQGKDDFNFIDLIPPEDSLATENLDTVPSQPLRFSVYNINITRSKVDYYDKQIDNRLLFDDLSLTLPKIAWNDQESEMGVEFEFGEKGLVSIGADINHQINSYHLAIGMKDLSLEPISNYVEQYINIDGISGNLNADVIIKGNINKTTDIVVSGSASVDTFKMWEPGNKDFLNLQRFFVKFDSLDLGSSNYYFSNIEIEQPVLTADLNKDKSNFERIFQAYLETDSIENDVESVKEADVDSSLLSYRIDTIKLINAKILFSDNTLNRPFKYDIKDINVSIGKITESTAKTPVDFSINLNDQGNLDGNTTFSIIDPYDLNVKAKLKKLRLMSFSPYSEYYITCPITKGDFNYDLSIEMSKTEMVNENQITINELEFGHKTKDTTGINAPIKLGLYLMKDPKDVIDINLPVKGNPSDPEFSVSKLIWKAFFNLLVKTAASPFNALGKLVSTHPEELETLPFEYAQDSLTVNQKETLNKIAIILHKKPELFFTFSQQTFAEIEKDSLAVAIAKKQMLIDRIKPNTEADYQKYHKQLAELTSDNDAFKSFVNKSVEGADTLALPLACRKLVGENELDEAFNKLLNDRSILLQHYLINEQQVDSSSVEIILSDLRNIPEQLKSPKFDIEVSIK